MNITKIAKSLWEDRRGVTAIEYGMIAALIAAVVVAGVTSLGTTVSTKFTGLNTSLGGS